MSWLLHFQWPAGIALMIYGILSWSDGIEPLLGARFSEWTERTAPNAMQRFWVGLFTGAALHGKRGFQYCKRRYLAGLLSPLSTAIFAAGMALGIFVPATLLIYLPYYWAFPLLIIGMAIQLSCRAPALRQAGQALLGLGCCWIGYTACRDAQLPPNLMMYGLLGAIILAACTHTPAAIFLAIASTIQSPTANGALLVITAIILALCWLVTLTIQLSRTKRPFDPPLSLLSKYDLQFPERALQAALQENRRMACGLAKAAAALASYQEQQEDSTSPLQLAADIESAMDEFKPAAQHFLLRLARYKLIERQAQLAMFLFVNIGDLERISDHLLAVANALPAPSRRPDYPESMLTCLDQILDKTSEIIDALAQSITGNRARKEHGPSGTVTETRDEALQLLDHFTAVLHDLILNKAIKPSRAIRMQELRSHFERLIRHVRAIAVAGEQDYFWIEPDLIHVRAKPASKIRTKDRLNETQIRDLLQEQPS